MHTWPAQTGKLSNEQHAITTTQGCGRQEGHPSGEILAGTQQLTAASQDTWLTPKGHTALRGKEEDTED